MYFFVSEYSYCYSIVSLFLPITNHTGRINLQIQSSYKSKVSQKYASLLYIANVYFFFQSIQNLCYSTQPVLIVQHIINIFISELHNHLENRSFFCNTTPSPRIFFHLYLTFLIPFALFYNEMVTVGKYIETKRVALLQTCRSMERSTVS